MTVLMTCLSVFKRLLTVFTIRFTVLTSLGPVRRSQGDSFLAMFNGSKDGLTACRVGVMKPQATETRQSAASCRPGIVLGGVLVDSQPCERTNLRAVLLRHFGTALAWCSSLRLMLRVEPERAPSAVDGRQTGQRGYRGHKHLITPAFRASTRPRAAQRQALHSLCLALNGVVTYALVCKN